MNPAAPTRPGQIAADSIFLEHGEGMTLQARLISAIVGHILGQRSPAGTRLPSSRDLARSLRVSRMTVTLVYNELVARGYLESRPRSGYVVAATVPARRVQSKSPPPATGSADGLDWSAWLNHQGARLRVITKPQDWRHYPFPFIYGQPDPSLFDHNAWRDCARRALGARDFSDLAADMMTRDDPMLLDYICSNTLARRGIEATPDNVLITVGAQNALYLTLDLISTGQRLAALEEPGYPDFAETLRVFGAPTQFIPVDEHGLDPARIASEARVVIVTPSHHIPTGATMPMDRRQQLLARASAQDFLVIEDDYDFEMSFLARPMPALKSLDREGRVIYLGSFSKSLFPGLRLGYLVAPEPMIAAARRKRAMMLRHPPAHLQRIAAYFMALGYYDTHIVRLREAMGARRAALIAALSGTPFTIGMASRWGGGSLWVAAPDGVDSGALALRARDHGVLIESGAVFFESPPPACPHFRMGYGSIGVDRIPEGVGRLASALADIS